MVPLAGFEPARPKRTADFESAASTIPPQRQLISYIPEAKFVQATVFKRPLHNSSFMQFGRQSKNCDPHLS